MPKESARPVSASGAYYLAPPFVGQWDGFFLAAFPLCHVRPVKRWFALILDGAERDKRVGLDCAVDRIVGERVVFLILPAMPVLFADDIAVAGDHLPVHELEGSMVGICGGGAGFDFIAGDELSVIRGVVCRIGLRLFYIHPPQVAAEARQWILLLGPQLLIGIIILWIFNPTGMKWRRTCRAKHYLRQTLFLWWGFRDLNSSEFYVGIIMLAAIPVCIWKRNIWLLRGLIAGFVISLTVVVFSPQHVSITLVANVRYLVPLIPLFIGLSALVILPIARDKWPVALVLAVVVFGSNALNNPFSPGGWR